MNHFTKNFALAQPPNQAAQADGNSHRWFNARVITSHYRTGLISRGRATAATLHVAAA